MNDHADSESSRNSGICRSDHLAQTDNLVLSGMVLNLVLNSRELDLLPGCMVVSSPLPVEVVCLVEICLLVVSAMERLGASADARPLIRSTSFGTYVGEKSNVNDSLLGWNGGGSESGPWRKVVQSKEWYASESVNEYPAGPNERKFVGLNASGGAISGIENENMSD